MPKISALTAQVTVPAATDRFAILDVSNTTNNATGELSYIEPPDVKAYVLGTGVSVGGTAAGDIATISGAQTLTNKTISDPKINSAAISGTVTVGVGCTMTSPTINTPTVTAPTITGATTIGAGATFTSPAITAPTITGAATVADGATITTPIIAAIRPSSGKSITVPNETSDTFATLAATQTFTNKTLTSPVLTTPVIASMKQAAGGGTITMPASAGADEVVLKDATQTMTNKTLTTPTITTPAVTGGTITGATIDATTTLDGTAVSTALGAKGDAASAYTHTCSYEKAIASPTTTVSITAAEIFTALNLVINSDTKTAADYDIVAESVQVTVYVVTDAATYTLKPWLAAGPIFTVNHTSSVVSSLAITGLTTDTTYRFVISFKLV